MPWASGVGALKAGCTLRGGPPVRMARGWVPGTLLLPGASALVLLPILHSRRLRSAPRLGWGLLGHEAQVRFRILGPASPEPSLDCKCTRAQ